MDIENLLKSLKGQDEKSRGQKKRQRGFKSAESD
jgi:hypothetical protein